MLCVCRTVEACGEWRLVLVGVVMLALDQWCWKLPAWVSPPVLEFEQVMATVVLPAWVSPPVLEHVLLLMVDQVLLCLLPAWVMPRFLER